jgi:hypothetical protein
MRPSCPECGEELFCIGNNTLPCEKCAAAPKAPPARVSINGVEVGELVNLTMGRVRSCGDCDACCTALAVDDHEDGPKPAGVRCPSLRSSARRLARGCLIYATRPASCRDYECGWLQGLMPDDFRPDRVGFIIDPWHPPDGSRDGVLFRELRPGALDSEPALAAREAIVDEVVVLMHTDGSRSLIGPVERVQRIMDFIQRRRQ